MYIVIDDKLTTARCTRCDAEFKIRDGHVCREKEGD